MTLVIPMDLARAVPVVQLHSYTNLDRWPRLDESTTNEVHSLFIRVPFRSSRCAEAINVDPINGVVEVAYKTGSIYSYSKVSRRAIMSLLFNPLISMGFWVNHNLLCKDSKTAKHGDYTIINRLSPDTNPSSLVSVS